MSGYSREGSTTPIMNEMMNFVLSALEELCNRALQYDEASRSALSQLAGNEIAIQCALPLNNEGFRFYINFNETGLLLKAYSEEQANASIEADNIKTLAEFFSARNGNIFQRGKLIIQGDLELVEALQDVLRELDIDWEEPLSKLVGDVAAHEIYRAINDAGDLLKKANDFIENDLSEGLNQLSARFFKARGRTISRSRAVISELPKTSQNFDQEISELNEMQTNLESSLDALEKNSRLNSKGAV